MYCAVDRILPENCVMLIALSVKLISCCANLGFCNTTVHAWWLLIHEGHRLALFILSLLLSTQIAQGLDVLLLSFILLLHTAQHAR